VKSAADRFAQQWTCPQRQILEDQGDLAERKSLVDVVDGALPEQWETCVAHVARARCR
jgi:hypothetical protein